MLERRRTLVLLEPLSLLVITDYCCLIVELLVREDLLNKADPKCPLMLNYSVFAKDNSLHNTPNTFGVYFTGLVFDWLKKKGGLEAQEDENSRKSKLTYAAIDGSKKFL